MTDLEIESRMVKLAVEERKITVEILLLIIESERRGIPLRHGFPSTFEWLVRKVGYSHSAAFRRMQASRLLADVPGIQIKLVSGALNLSSVSKTQGAIYKTEKKIKEKVPIAKKVEVLEQIEHATPLEIDKVIAVAFPEIVHKKKERASYTAHDRVQLVLDMSEESHKKLQRVREVRSHTMAKETWGELVGYIAADWLKRHDPLERAKRSRKQRSNA